MSKIKRELEELRKEVGTHDALIHDIYSSLIRRLNREIGVSSVTDKDADSIMELSRKNTFLEIELKEKNKVAYKEHKDWEKKKEKLFCCSRMAQAVKGKVFKPIYYDTDLTKSQYYTFSFRVDSNLSVSAIIHYCPFCGKMIGTKETKQEKKNKRGTEQGKENRGNNE